MRRALGHRYRHIFVDEFQDTDPIQAEILFRIAADDAPRDWQDSDLRAGALFMVGDPKQAIYRFRGADVGILRARRAAPSRGAGRTTSCRSRRTSARGRPSSTIINDCFEAPLSARGQPGYVALAPTHRPAGPRSACAAKITIDLPPRPRAEQIATPKPRPSPISARG